MKIARLWDDLEELGNSSGRYYYRKAVVTWSRPRVWDSEDENFSVPDAWSGHGGLYILLRDNRNQVGRNRISYIGKALNFNKRLRRRHHMFDELVLKRGQTKVSCGRVRFERIRSHQGYYEQLEDIVKFTVWDYLRNRHGFESLPGFRGEFGRQFRPWIISNEGYKFGGIMPRTIAYPAIGVSFARVIFV